MRLLKVPGRCCSPRHRIAFNSREEGYKCVSMMWRAISAKPYCGDVGSVGVVLIVISGGGGGSGGVNRGLLLLDVLEDMAQV